MFIGHFAVALAAKKAVPNVSLPILVAASQIVDLIWPVLLLVGVEHVRIDAGNTVVTPLDFYDYPITHSLFGAVMWSLLFAAAVYRWKKVPKEAIVVGLVVFSHWLLDLATHRPDLPLMGNDSVKFGFGLWNSLWGTMIVEFGLFALGVYVYASVTEAKNKKGIFSLYALAVFLVLIHLGNLFGPPPPDVQMIAVAGNAMWLIVLWAWWIEKHRLIKSA